MNVRPLARGEEEALAKVAHAAFRVGVALPGESDHAHWLRYYTENPHVTGGETIIAEEAGKILGGATALHFEMSLGGVDVPMRGFAAVVVAPDARRRGVADAVMRETLSRLKKRGDPIAMLRPFQMTFYRKFGFGSCEALDVLRVAPKQLPDSEHRLGVRTYNARYNYDPLERVYEHARAQNLRGAGALKRSAYWWKKRVLRNYPDVVVFEDARGITGYAIYEIPTTPGYPNQECRVTELVATSPEASRGLIGFFCALGHQFNVVDLSLPRSQSHALVIDHESIGNDPLHRESIGFIHTMNMARLLDVPKALALHPLPARRDVRGEIGLDIHDPLEKQPVSLDIAFDSGAHATAGSNIKERLSLRTDRLAQIYFGASRAVDLLASGFISGSAHAAEKIDDALFGLEQFGGPLNNF